MGEEIATFQKDEPKLVKQKKTNKKQEAPELLRTLNPHILGKVEVGRDSMDKTQFRDQERMGR